MKATIPIAVQRGTKLLQLSYVPEEQCYVLWLQHNLAMTQGTLMRLRMNGKIERVTVNADGTETIHDVT